MSHYGAGGGPEWDQFWGINPTRIAPKHYNYSIVFYGSLNALLIDDRVYLPPVCLPARPHGEWNVKKEAKLLLGKAIDSLVLSIDHFNRLWDQGRIHATLILLDHSFEMLLKASIIKKGGKIKEKGAKETIGFDKCVRKCYSDSKVNFLTSEQALTLQTINGYRDAAQHHLLDISEQHIYLQAQTGLTLFKDIVKKVFDIELSQQLPRRALPLSTTPIMDLDALFTSEVDEVRKLLVPGKRRGVEASSKIRALAIMEGAINGERSQPSQSEINKYRKLIVENKNWEKAFPGVASINLTHTGEGPTIELRITKKEGIPVHIVPEGTPSSYPVGIKRVNELSFYSFGLKDLAQKLGLSPPKTTALVRYLNIADDEEYFKEFKIGGISHKRYSQKTIKKLAETIQNSPDIVNESWENRDF